MQLDIDVPMVVEDPAIHIIGRSSSSLCDQMHYIECRRECLLGLAEGVVTMAGILVNDLVRFFHGDRPAIKSEGITVALGVRHTVLGLMI